MAKFVVVIPFARMTPDNGTQSFTLGDEVLLSEKEAKDLLEAGIVTQIEQPAVPDAGEEPTAKPKGRKTKGQK
jgi:hypothetical protein